MKSPLDFFEAEHQLVRERLAEMRRVTVLFDYPPELLHEIQEGWPEIQETLKNHCLPFAHALKDHLWIEENFLFPRLATRLMAQEKEILEEMTNDTPGLGQLSQSMVDLITPWTKTAHLPTAHDRQRFRDLYMELDLHLEQHTRLFHEKLLPLAERRISGRDLAAISDEIKEHLAGGRPSVG